MPIMTIARALRLLGLDDNQLNEESVKKVYRNLARTKHPDKGGDPAEFTPITSAYEHLLAITECQFFLDIKHLKKLEATAVALEEKIAPLEQPLFAAKARCQAISSAVSACETNLVTCSTKLAHLKEFIFNQQEAKEILKKKTNATFSQILAKIASEKKDEETRFFQSFFGWERAKPATDLWKKLTAEFKPFACTPLEFDNIPDYKEVEKKAQPTKVDTLDQLIRAEIYFETLSPILQNIEKQYKIEERGVTLLAEWSDLDGLQRSLQEREREIKSIIDTAQEWVEAEKEKKAKAEEAKAIREEKIATEQKAAEAAKENPESSAPSDFEIYFRQDDIFGKHETLSPAPKRPYFVLFKDGLYYKEDPAIALKDSDNVYGNYERPDKTYSDELLRSFKPNKALPKSNRRLTQGEHLKFMNDYDVPKPSPELKSKLALALDLKLKAEAFIKIYRALHAGQSSRFKTNFLDDVAFDELNPQDFLDKIATREHNRPNGRAAKAWALAKIHYTNLDLQKNVELFKSIHEWSFKQSGFLSITKISGGMTFFRCCYRDHDSLTGQDISQKAANDPTSRTAKIWRVFNP
jgi:hypothetical protein